MKHAQHCGIYNFASDGRCTCNLDARAHAMADEYEAWIAFYHRGDGDYTDFLRKRLPTDAPHGVGVPLKEQQR